MGLTDPQTKACLAILAAAVAPHVSVSLASGRPYLRSSELRWTRTETWFVVLKQVCLNLKDFIFLFFVD